MRLWATFREEQDLQYTRGSGEHSEKNKINNILEALESIQEKNKINNILDALVSIQRRTRSTIY